MRFATSWLPISSSNATRSNATAHASRSPQRAEELETPFPVAATNRRRGEASLRGHGRALLLALFLAVPTPERAAADVGGGTSNDVVRFDADGTFLGELTHPDLTSPQGLAFDDRGHLFASSFSKNHIVEFDAEGNHVQTFGQGPAEGDLDLPRSLAFSPIPEPAAGLRLLVGAGALGRCARKRKRG